MSEVHWTAGVVVWAPMFPDSQLLVRVQLRMASAACLCPPLYLPHALHRHLKSILKQTFKREKNDRGAQCAKGPLTCIVTEDVSYNHEEKGHTDDLRHDGSCQ